MAKKTDEYKVKRIENGWLLTYHDFGKNEFISTFFKSLRELVLTLCEIEGDKWFIRA